MCMVFQVGRSGYYNWLPREPSLLARSREKMSEKFEIIFHRSKGRYGSPKIVKELKSQRLYASRPEVARVMKKKGFRSIITGKFKVCLYNR
ncbi:IS3 family transposase [Chitinophaga sp. LS1]|uniref:IS3 family transposase n=1 Tax=Chitinophaga sp. LS1 TaxID=3051176 RepID=UPI0039F06704